MRSPRQSLWIAEDHLLSIDSASYSEDYKRFYFRDIQAFFICATGRRAVWNGILGALLVMHVLVLGWLGAPTVILASIAVILSAPLVVNNVLGPACRVYVQTAVQVEELPSLGRIRRARRVLGRIRPLIVESQGSLPVEEPVSASTEEPQ